MASAKDRAAPALAPARARRLSRCIPAASLRPVPTRVAQPRRTPLAAERPIPTGPLSPGPHHPSSRGSTAGRTSGPTSRPSTWSSTSASWRSTRPTPCPGFTDGLLELLPGLTTAHLLAGSPRRVSSSGFARAPGWVTSPSTSPCSSRREAGHDQSPRQDPRRQGRARVYNVIYGYLDETGGLAAGQLAVRLVNHLVQPEEDFDFHDASSNGSCGGPSGPRSARRPRRSSTRPSAATFPGIRLNERVPRPARPGRPPAAHPRHDDVADRRPGRRHRRRQGPHRPAAGSRPAFRCRVRSRCAPTTRRSMAARRIGYPVVVKPLDGNHGRGVCLNLQRRRRGRARRSTRAWRSPGAATSWSSRSSPAGLPLPHRRRPDAVAIAERVPAHVDRRRRRTPSPSWSRSPTPTLGAASATRRCSPGSGRRCRRRDAVPGRATRWTSVPPEGEMVKLALTGNMSTGGISIDRTFDAHPDNVEIAEEAARIVGLDVAGHRLHLPRHRLTRSARPAARSARSTPRPASGCTPTRPSASRSSSPSRSSTCSSRRERRRGSRSSPSPAPTARRRRRA